MMVFSVMSTILVIVIATPIFLAVIVPLSIFYVLVQVSLELFILCSFYNLSLNTHSQYGVPLNIL